MFTQQGHLGIWYLGILSGSYNVIFQIAAKVFAQNLRIYLFFILFKINIGPH